MPLDWPTALDDLDAEHDAALAEDDAYPVPPPANCVPRRREDLPAMKNALALVAASGRASRYARQSAGTDPVLHRRIYRWAIRHLTGG